MDMEYRRKTDGYQLFLNGQPLKTPQQKPLVLPTKALATALIEEWQQQTEPLDPASMSFASMPFTVLANTALDRIAPHREAVLDALLKYAEYDCLCYPAPFPEALTRRQQAAWQPVIDQVARMYQARLEPANNSLVAPQPQEALTRLRHIARVYDSMTLSALSSIVTATHSFLLGLCLAENHIDAENAFRLSCLEESYQIETWGTNPQIEARRQSIKQDIHDAACFMGLCRRPDIG